MNGLIKYSLIWSDKRTSYECYYGLQGDVWEKCTQICSEVGGGGIQQPALHLATTEIDYKDYSHYFTLTLW